jgi:hypothetical protein
MIERRDPGPCPICGAAHTTCTSSLCPILVAQLPSRDEMPSVPLVAEAVQATLPKGQVTTGTYRRQKTT